MLRFDGRHVLNPIPSFLLFLQRVVLLEFLLVEILPTLLLIFLEPVVGQLQGPVDLCELVLLLLQLDDLSLHELDDGFAVKAGHL